MTSFTFSPYPFIAMNPAFRTNRLVRPEYTLIHPLVGILQQSLAVVTQVFVMVMMMMAVKPDHMPDSYFFSFNTGFHNAMIVKIKFDNFTAHMDPSILRM
jgi:hypothetical protein